MEPFAVYWATQMDIGSSRCVRRRESIGEGRMRLRLTEVEVTMGDNMTLHSIESKMMFTTG